MTTLTAEKILKLVGKKRAAKIEVIDFDGSNPEVITVEMVYPWVNESTIHVFEFGDEDTQQIYIDDLKFFLDCAKEDKNNHAWRNYK